MKPFKNSLRKYFVSIPPALDIIYDAVSEGVTTAIVCLVKYLISSKSVLRMVERVQIPAIVLATDEALKFAEFRSLIRWL